MTLNDYLAKLSIEKIKKTKILENRIILPVEIDSFQFYKDFKDKIKSNTLTHEKAIFAASLIEKKPFLSISQILNSKIKLIK